MRHSPRYEIKFQDVNTDRVKLVEVEILTNEYDEAMKSADPPLILEAYALKRAYQMVPPGYRAVLPDGLRRVAVN
jgi:hypothetical protein